MSEQTLLGWEKLAQAICFALSLPGPVYLDKSDFVVCTYVM